MLMLTSNLLVRGGCPAWATRWVSQTDWKLRILGSAALEAVQVGAGVAHGAITINGQTLGCRRPRRDCSRSRRAGD